MSVLVFKSRLLRSKIVFQHPFSFLSQEQATQNQTTVLVVTCGTVKFDGNKQQFFNQNFLLTEQTTNNNTVWKVMSDCLRFQESPHQQEEQNVFFWIFFFLNSPGFGDEPVEYGNSPVSVPLWTSHSYSICCF